MDTFDLALHQATTVREVIQVLKDHLNYTSASVVEAKFWATAEKAGYQAEDVDLFAAKFSALRVYYGK